MNFYSLIVINESLDMDKISLFLTHVFILAMSGDDLRRRKGGKEAREVKVRK